MKIVIKRFDVHAAGEVWPGQPISAHWGMPDPAVGENDIGQIARQPA